MAQSVRAALFGPCLRKRNIGFPSLNAFAPSALTDRPVPRNEDVPRRHNILYQKTAVPNWMHAFILSFPVAVHETLGNQRAAVASLNKCWRLFWSLPDRGHSSIRSAGFLSLSLMHIDAFEVTKKKGPKSSATFPFIPKLQHFVVAISLFPNWCSQSSVLVRFLSMAML